MNDLESAFFPLTVAPLTQVLAGEAPFNDVPDDARIMLAVLGGKRPLRPTHPSCTESLWALIKYCWQQDPGSRPKILEVSQALSSVSTN